MKILYVIPHFYPALSFGGPVTFLWELAKRASRKGHHVHVYTTDVFDSNRRISTKDKEKVLKEGVRVDYFKNINNRLAYDNFHSPLLFFPNLPRSLDDFDIVHINEVFSLVCFWAAFCSFLRKKPFILSSHGSLTSSSLKGKNTLKKIFLFLTLRYFLKADFALALSDKEKSEYKRFGFADSKIKKLPLGVSLPEKPDNYKPAHFTSDNKPWGRGKTILFLGRLQKQKNLFFLLESFKLVQKNIKNARLVLAGPDMGEEKGLKLWALKNLGRESCHFTGLVQGKEKDGLLRSADCFVMCSHFEGMPVSLLEALSFGVPSVITESCNFADLQKYDCGKITPVDKDSFSRAIIGILNDSRRAKVMSENGKKLIRDKYTWDKVSGQYLDIYKQVLKNK